MGKFKVSFVGNKRINVTCNTFEIKTDQKKENGGEETAPEPFELFLASLGSCAGIYAHSFCEARNLPTNDMHLTLEAFFKEGQKLLDKIEITLFVNQSFPEKYIKAVIKSMSGCAVKNQLHPDLNVQTAVSYLQE